MSSIQLIVDGALVYQSDATPPPPPPMYVPLAPTPPPPPSTTFGNVARVINYSDGYVALNGIEMYGINAVYTIGIQVASTDTSIGKAYLPVWVGTNSPVTQISQRTVSVSLSPNDFNPATAQIITSGASDFAVSFTTETARVGQGVALLQPGRTYYVNVRNDTARAGISYILDGQYKNWNR